MITRTTPDEQCADREPACGSRPGGAGRRLDSVAAALAAAAVFPFPFDSVGAGALLADLGGVFRAPLAAL